MKELFHCVVRNCRLRPFNIGMVLCYIPIVVNLCFMACWADGPIELWEQAGRKMKNLSVEWVENKSENSIGGEEVKYEISSVMKLLDSRARYEYSGHIFDDDPFSESGPQLREVKSINVRDGDYSRQLRPPVEGQDFATGVIYRKGKSPIVEIVCTAPILWTIRPFDPQLGGFLRAEVKRVASGVPVSGEDCEEVSIGPWKFWLSPTHHMPIRMVHYAGQRPTRRIDIQFGNQDGVYLPMNWQFTTFNSSHRLEASVIKWNVNTSSIKKEDFVLDFAPRTLVVDMSGDKVADYIVKESGEKRIITNEEANAGYSRWVETESGMASDNPRDFYYVIAGFLLLVCLLGIRFSLKKGWFRR